MIGCYDFCGHYEWTFQWLHEQGGHDLVRQYWDEAIHQDSQSHAARLIQEGGFDGMERYWGHTLGEEGGQWHVTRQERLFRIDMHQCPSKGFLLRNGLESCQDYCDHCMGWIGPMMRQAGYAISHQHNHRGQCWWEMRRQQDSPPAASPGSVSGALDVRLRAEWQPAGAQLDSYEHTTDPDDKLPPPPPPAGHQPLPGLGEAAPAT